MGPDNQRRNQAMAGVASELLFAGLPLVGVFLVFVYLGRPERWAHSAEWAFGAAILFGQTVVKFTSGVSRGGAAAAPVALATTLLIVAGLAPSLLVLTMVLLASESQHEPEVWLRRAQVGLFVVASCCYFVLGTIGELWRHRQ